MRSQSAARETPFEQRRHTSMDKLLTAIGVRLADYLERRNDRVRM